MRPRPLRRAVGPTALLLAVALLVLPGPSGSAGAHPPAVRSPTIPIPSADSAVANAALRAAQLSLNASAPSSNLTPGWRLVPGAGGPSARYGSAMAYDPGLGVVVLFGGTDGTTYDNDTWEFSAAGPSGGAWHRFIGSKLPLGRAFAAMAYDDANDAVVMFGGVGAAGYQNNTWKFGAGGWSLINSSGPLRRDGAGMTYDEASTRLLLFGGTDGAAVYDDLYFLNGSRWVPITTGPGPAARSGASFAYDPLLGGDLLVGGRNLTAPVLDDWLLVGENWSSEELGTGSASTFGATSAFDAADGAFLVAGGNTSSGTQSATFLLPADDQWTAPSGTASYLAIVDAASCFDDAIGGVVSFGGSVAGSPSGGTWVFSLGTAPLNWTLLSPLNEPPRRTQAALAYDAADGYVVLFGGQNHSTTDTGNLPREGGRSAQPAPSPYYNDTWVFQDFRWREIYPTVAPPARRGAIATYDYRDGYLLLFGGSNGTQYFDDTWTFRGGQWTELFPATQPIPRRSFGLTYDFADSEVVLFGGHNGVPGPNGPSQVNYTFYNDTWSFVAGVWTRLHPTGPPPPPDAEPFFGYDPAAGYIVLYGGYREATTTAKATGTGQNTMLYTYAFVHDAWTNLTAAEAGHQPDPRAGGDNGGFGFDFQTGAMVMWGGNWLQQSTNGSHPLPYQCYLNCSIPTVWSFANGVWNESCAACAPYGRASSGGTEDPALGALVTFGGVMNGNGGTSLGAAKFAPRIVLVPNGTDIGHVESLSFAPLGGFQPLSNATVDFGDGTTVAGWSANHTYLAPGSYPARVSYDDAIGNVSVVNLTLVVHPPLAAQLSGSPWNLGNRSLLGGRLNVTLLGGTPPMQFVYAWGDGSHTTTSSPFATHVYRAGGAYRGNVSIVDALGELTNATSNDFELPAVPPSLALTAAVASAPVPVNITFRTALVDAYGGATYRWTTTAGNLTANGSAATLYLNRTGPATVEVTMTDAANFSANASTTVDGLQTLVPGFQYQESTSVPCPIRPDSVAVTFNASARGGTAPYQFGWSIGPSAATGAVTTAYLTPGSVVAVVLNLSDAAGDHATTSRTILVPSASCGPGGGGLSGTDWALIGIGGLVAAVILIEAAVLLRARRRRGSPPAADAGDGPVP